MRLLKQLFSSGKAGEARAARMAEAHAHFDAGRFDAAARSYAVIAAREPSPEVFVNLGYSRCLSGDEAGAASAFQQALAMNAGSAQACVGLGDIAAQSADHRLALQYYDRAVACAPDFAVAHNNRSHSLMTLGRLQEAWRESEWRFASPGAEALYPHRYVLPRWDGRPCVGKLLVHWEQGFGDILQHLRFLHVLEERGIDFVFECPPPLFKLVSRSLRPGRVVGAHAGAADTSGCSSVCGLLSLPALLPTDADRIPKPPYLVAEKAQVEGLGAVRGDSEGRLLGIAWRGSSFDPSRNSGLKEFSALHQAGARIVSLQKDVTTEEREMLSSMGALDMSPLLTDFAATADVIAALDAVISVDTAVAHLAGALNHPLQVLLNQSAAARWMLARVDTPWYPSARLQRKTAHEPWTIPVERALSCVLAAG